MKPTPRVKLAKIAEQTTALNIRISPQLLSEIQQQASAMQISVSELIRRRCENKALPDFSTDTERLLVMTINVVAELSRVIRMQNGASLHNIAALEALNHLARDMKLLTTAPLMKGKPHETDD